MVVVVVVLFEACRLAGRPGKVRMDSSPVNNNNSCLLHTTHLTPEVQRFSVQVQQNLIEMQGDAGKLLDTC